MDPFPVLVGVVLVAGVLVNRGVFWLSDRLGRAAERVVGGF